MTKQIQQTYTINAPVSKVWQALTDTAVAEQWGASPAKVDAREGGEFSYWDGDIHGVYTKLVPEKLIEQDWYGHDNPDWKYIAVFTLHGDEKTTTVQLTFSGNILDEQKDIADWRDYYFDPIKKLLERDAHTSDAAKNGYPKLVRDKIPQIIKQNDGIDVPVRILDDEAFQSHLLKKVVEEAEELSRANTDTDLQEEIADVYEVIDTLIKLKKFSPEAIAALQTKKREKRGGFEQRLLMLHNSTGSS